MNLSDDEIKFLKCYIISLKEQVKLLNPHHFWNTWAYAQACNLTTEQEYNLVETFRIETDDPPSIVFIERIK